MFETFNNKMLGKILENIFNKKRNDGTHSGMNTVEE